MVRRLYLLVCLLFMCGHWGGPVTCLAWLEPKIFITLLTFCKIIETHLDACVQLIYLWYGLYSIYIFTWRCCNTSKQIRPSYTECIVQLPALGSVRFVFRATYDLRRVRSIIAKILTPPYIIRSPLGALLLWLKHKWIACDTSSKHGPSSTQPTVRTKPTGQTRWCYSAY